MNTLLTLVSLLVAAFLLVSWVASRPRGHQLFSFGNTAPANAGVHKAGRVTYLADAAITTRHKLVKIGTDAGHIAIPTAVADEPIGVCIDEPTAAEDPVTVILLGAHNGTLLAVAGGAITDGAGLYMNNAGALTVKPTAAGTYWFVGNARGAWSTGETFPFIPCIPLKVTVVAALTQTSNATIAGLTSSATTTQAEFNALKTEAGKLQADFYALKAGIDAAKTGVAYATT